MAEKRKHVLQTQLLLYKSGKSANDRLLFGRPNSTHHASKLAVMHVFKEGQLFGFVRWRGDSFGTQTWRVLVAQAGRDKQVLTQIPGVKPGANLLLHAFGNTRVKRALRAIDNPSEAHVLHAVAPAYWRHVHLQISQNLPLETYDASAFDRIDRAQGV